MTREAETRAAALRALAPEALAALVLERAAADEGFALWLDTRLAAGMPALEAGRLDPAPFRRRAEALLSAAGPGRRRYRHWDEPGAGVDEEALEELIDAAEPSLAAGRGVDALAILTPVAEALVAYWPECAQWDESLHEFFPRLDRMIAQAVLLDGVAREARDVLADELSGWQDELAEHGADDAFSTAIAACMQGWDEPGLQDALAGRGRDWPPGRGGDPAEDALTSARLAALDAMGRTEAYLHLSRASGFHCDHAVKLARMGRIDEAVVTAHAHLAAPDDILRLAQAVAAAGRTDAALDLAAWGLALPMHREPADAWRLASGRSSLARWLRAAAHEAGRRDMTLMAAQAAFEESLARDDFHAACRLAGPQDWPALRETLLAILVAAPRAAERIDILLDEDRVDAAVACIDPHAARAFGPRDGALQRLAERACAGHPDWTIALAFRIAEPIIDEGRSGDYADAAHWLGIAARAYAASGRAGAWRARLDGLIETHRRKHKLRRMLEALRPAPG